MMAEIRAAKMLRSLGINPPTGQTQGLPPQNRKLPPLRPPSNAVPSSESKVASWAQRCGDFLDIKRPAKRRLSFSDAEFFESQLVSSTVDQKVVSEPETNIGNASPTGIGSGEFFESQLVSSTVDQKVVSEPEANIGNASPTGIGCGEEILEGLEPHQGQAATQGPAQGEAVPKRKDPITEDVSRTIPPRPSPSSSGSSSDDNIPLNVIYQAIIETRKKPDVDKSKSSIDQRECLESGKVKKNPQDKSNASRPVSKQTTSPFKEGNAGKKSMTKSGASELTLNPKTGAPKEKEECLANDKQKKKPVIDSNASLPISKPKTSSSKEGNDRKISGIKSGASELTPKPKRGASKATTSKDMKECLAKDKRKKKPVIDSNASPPISKPKTSPSKEGNDRKISGIKSGASELISKPKRGASKATTSKDKKECLANDKKKKKPVIDSNASLPISKPKTSPSKEGNDRKMSGIKSGASELISKPQRVASKATTSKDMEECLANDKENKKPVIDSNASLPISKPKTSLSKEGNDRKMSGIKSGASELTPKPKRGASKATTSKDMKVCLANDKEKKRPVIESNASLLISKRKTSPSKDGNDRKMSGIKSGASELPPRPKRGASKATTSKDKNKCLEEGDAVIKSDASALFSVSKGKPIKESPTVANPSGNPKLITDPSNSSTLDQENKENLTSRVALDHGPQLSAGVPSSQINFSVNFPAKTMDERYGSTALPVMSWKWPSQRRKEQSLSSPVSKINKLSDFVFKVPTPKSKPTNLTDLKTNCDQELGQDDNNNSFDSSLDLGLDMSFPDELFDLSSSKPLDLSNVSSPGNSNKSPNEKKSQRSDTLLNIPMKNKKELNNRATQAKVRTTATPELKGHDSLSMVHSTPLHNTQYDSASSTASSYRFRKRSQATVYVDELEDDSEVDDDHDDDDVEWCIGDLVSETCRTEDNDDKGSGSDEEGVVLTLPKNSLKQKWQKKLQLQTATTEKPKSKSTGKNKPEATKKETSKSAGKKKSKATENEKSKSTRKKKSATTSTPETDLCPWGNDPIIEAVLTPTFVPSISESLLMPHEYFEHFISDSFLLKVVEHTNTFSTFQSHGTKSIDLTVSELKKFIGCWMFMGIAQLPSMRDYWAPETRVPRVADTMSFNRFQSIRSSLHFYDKSQEDSLDPSDRFAKVRLLLDQMKQKCNELQQGSDYSIDEAMVPYKGKYAGSLRQFIKSKPHRFGIKIFNLADSNGIIYDFLPYAGTKTFEGIDFSEQEKAMGLGAKVIIYLSRCIDNPSCKAVFFDNYFSSPGLVKYLKESMNLLSTGTLRANRSEQCPLISDEILKKSERGTFDFKSRDGVGVTKWLDNKIVHIVSSHAGIEPVSTANRYDKTNKEKLQVPMPRVVQLYNSKMGGVDLNDMLVELHRTPTRSKRWYMSLVGYMLDVAAVNSWLLYRRHGESLRKEKQDKEDLQEEEEEEEEEKGEEKMIGCSKDFRLAIIKYLMGQGTLGSVPTGPKVKRVINNPRAGIRPDATVRFDRLDHWPSFTMKQGRCKYCKNGYTTIVCLKCNEINLCFVPTRPCFLKYHLPDV